MSSNAPWAPTQGAGTTDTTTGPSPEAAKVNGHAAAEQVQDVIDENDPRLISETLEANVEGDAYAQPAPPPDGKYKVKLKLEGVAQEGTEEKKDFTAKSDKNNNLYYQTSISCSIIDPSGKYDGITLYPAFGGGVNTMVRRDKSTQVTTLLHRIKGPDGRPYTEGFRGTPREWMQRLVKVLATEPEVGVETMWEASCQKCGEIAKAAAQASGGKVEYPVRTQGMHHFPPEQDASKRKAGQLYSPELKCAKDPSHGYARARAIVTRFLHLQELK